MLQTNILHEKHKLKLQLQTGFSFFFKKGIECYFSYKKEVII